MMLSISLIYQLLAIVSIFSPARGLSLFMAIHESMAQDAGAAGDNH